MFCLTIRRERNISLPCARGCPSQCLSWTGLAGDEIRTGFAGRYRHLASDMALRCHPSTHPACSCLRGHLLGWIMNGLVADRGPRPRPFGIQEWPLVSDLFVAPGKRAGWGHAVISGLQTSEKRTVTWPPNEEADSEIARVKITRTLHCMPTTKAARPGKQAINAKTSTCIRVRYDAKFNVHRAQEYERTYLLWLDQRTHRSSGNTSISISPVQRHHNSGMVVATFIFFSLSVQISHGGS
jgi:hypothetical protein